MRLPIKLEQAHRFEQNFLFLNVQQEAIGDVLY